MRIVVGISGGVDSSVAAYLLKKQGHDVIGLFMVNWEEKDGTCTAEEDFEDVKRVCNKIGIPYYSVNYSKEYYDRVFEYFLEEYKKGRTPNPDVLCNREVKFGPFLEQAKKLGADMIATGHYAKKIEKDGKFYLAKAKDLNKDQSYFLNQLNQSQLGSVIFPLEDIEKPRVREIAKELELSNATKKDSTGICFIGERNFKNFLKEYLPAKPGDILDLNGNIVGKHDGLMYYTLGQRRGLNIGGTEKRLFVAKKDLENNILYVAMGDENKYLISHEAVIEEVNLLDELPKQCTAKFRYRQKDNDVIVSKLDDGNLLVKYPEGVKSVTPGQACVLYNGDECLGGGIIKEVR